MSAKENAEKNQSFWKNFKKDILKDIRSGFIGAIVGVLISIVIFTKSSIIAFLELPLKTRDRVEIIEHKQDSMDKVSTKKLDISEFDSHKDLNAEQFKSIESKLEIMLNLMYDMKKTKISINPISDTTNNNIVNIEFKNKSIN